MTGMDPEPSEWFAITARYARPNGEGAPFHGGHRRPARCTAAGGRDGRVIFDTEEQARQAAFELHEAGAQLLTVWECEFDAVDRHWHLRAAVPPYA